jgi:hypothetical protein
MNNKTLNTVLTVGAFAIGLIGLILCIMIMLGSEGAIDTAINLSLFLMVAAAGAAVVFGLFHFLGNIKKNMPLLIGIIGFVVLAFICYALASDEVLRSYGPDITPSTSKLSGAGLLIMYVLVGIAVFAALAGEIIKIFK